jgi:predicted transcriptional regulator of viral defense system
VKVAEEYVEGPGVEEVVTGPACIASPERTIVDALNHPAWLGGARHVANALLEYARYGSWNENHLYAVMDELLTGAGIKRLAAFIRCRNLFEYSMLRLEFWDRRTTGIVDLGPGEATGGWVNRAARVRLNVELDPSDEEEGEEGEDEMAASD